MVARAALVKAKADATTDRLAEYEVPQGASWAVEARNKALARLTETGLPHRRDEYWKYTDPSSLVVAQAPEAALFENDEGPAFDAIDRIKIVFVDGVFDAAASSDLSAEGLEIERLAKAVESDDHWVKDLFGVLEGRNAQGAVPRPLAAMNTAIALDGVCIRATAKVTKPVNLIYLHKSKVSDAYLHHCIKVEGGAEFTLLETGPAAARFSKVMEVDVADGGAFHHVRAQGRDHERRAYTAQFGRLGEGSTYKSFTLTANGVLTRNESVIELTGDNAVTHIAGAAVGDGSDFLHDDTVFITHDAVGCESRQVFKKVLRNGAVGVFQGKILVRPDAQKTDGYQISQSLLLDDDSQFLAKPELEIYADDVACSHGSTSGAINEDALFYLKSRGVPHHEATNLLTLAFLAEALDEIENKAFADDLYERLSNWLNRRVK
ncbi:SufD family Fe-S cluster assembly protein [Pelagovum sp. HNIBRBA483]|uniref:SufB/SufD family protein n=1 Tax=Pelagovum sp. HNIBRBA483 TaxID=3233341 RepID=UPI0034A2FF49